MNGHFAYDYNVKLLLFGTFDHLHPGHKFLLESALKRGETSIIIARDENVRLIKGRMPDQSEEERKKAVERAFPDAHVLLGDRKDFLAPIRAAHPDLILLGYDQSLPPGVTEADLGAPIERLPGHEPHKYKSSLRRQK